VLLACLRIAVRAGGGLTAVVIVMVTDQMNLEFEAAWENGGDFGAYT